MPELNVNLYGPVGGPEILAIHGMTGHGQRWASLAEHQLPDARFIAPDILGHGRSPWIPPWNIETQVEYLRRALTQHAHGPVLVLAHSYGAALALHLARAEPDSMRALVLLDPAIGLDADELLDTAESSARYPDYTDASEARSEKVHGAWGEVPAEMLDREIDEHLIPATDGRVQWRYSTPAIVASWGELARPFVLPVGRIPTVLVQAMHVQPPYVRSEFRDALSDHLGDALRIIEMDCDHMVPQARPDEVAALVRTLL